MRRSPRSWRKCASMIPFPQRASLSSVRRRAVLNYWLVCRTITGREAYRLRLHPEAGRKGGHGGLLRWQARRNREPAGPASHGRRCRCGRKRPRRAGSRNASGHAAGGAEPSGLQLPGAEAEELPEPEPLLHLRRHPRRQHLRLRTGRRQRAEHGATPAALPGEVSLGWLTAAYAG